MNSTATSHLCLAQVAEVTRCDAIQQDAGYRRVNPYLEEPKPDT